MKITIAKARELIQTNLSNKTHILQKTSNKGGVGHFIEESISISKNSD